MYRVFLKQTVERQGSLVFCVSKSSAAERERVEPLERMSVFAGNARYRCSILMEKLVLCFVGEIFTQ